MEKFFKLKENGTNVSTEIMAGITTFMTMAYILAVNPNILSASGMDRGAVFTATALSAFIATCLMALLSNYPFVLAPGMGLNAYFAYTVVLGMGYTWQAALAAVFVEGMIILLVADLGGAFDMIGQVMIYLALVLTVVSLVDYIAKNKQVLKMQN